MLADLKRGIRRWCELSVMYQILLFHIPVISSEKFLSLGVCDFESRLFINKTILSSAMLVELQNEPSKVSRIAEKQNEPSKVSRITEHEKLIGIQ